MKEREGYRHLLLDTTDRRFYEPLTLLSDYGIDGQRYYSRPNPLTTVPMPGVPREIYLRKSVAEVLARLNQALHHALAAQADGQQKTIFLLFGGSHRKPMERRLREYNLRYTSQIYRSQEYTWYDSDEIDTYTARNVMVNYAIAHVMDEREVTGQYFDDLHVDVAAAIGHLSPTLLGTIYELHRSGIAKQEQQSDLEHLLQLFDLLAPAQQLDAAILTSTKQSPDGGSPRR